MKRLYGSVSLYVAHVCNMEDYVYTHTHTHTHTLTHSLAPHTQTHRHTHTHYGLECCRVCPKLDILKNS